MDPTLFLSFLVGNVGHYNFTMLQLLSLTKCFSMHCIHDKFCYKNVLDAEYIKVCFNNWHLDELKVSWDGGTCRIIQKKCH